RRANSRNGIYGISTADRPHSALMLRARMTLPHFSVSSAMNLPKSAGESARMHHYDVRLPVSACDRRDVADEIVAEPFVQARIERVDEIDQQQRVSVGSSTHNCLSPNIAAPSWSIFGDELLAEPLCQPLTQKTRQQVGWPSSGGGHNDAHRTRRIGLRHRDTRHRRQRGSACGQMQKSTAR